MTSDDSKARAKFNAACTADKYNVNGIVQFLLKSIAQTPDVGIICGSGLNDLHEMLSDRIVLPYHSIPGFPVSTVQGHAGELVFGKLGATYVVLMRGRFHFYEGYEVSKVAMPVRVMAALGVRVVVVTNASGGVNPDFDIGNFMIIQDHLSFPGLSGANALVGPNDERFGTRFPAVTPAYNPVLRELAEKAAAELSLQSRMRRGTYCGVSGPSYETPHEIQMLRLLGGDAVGMSTVPEIVEAAHCGIAVLGLAMITNKCKGPSDDFPCPTHEEVLDSVKASAAEMKGLVTKFVSTLPVTDFPQSAAHALFTKYGPGAPGPTKPSNPAHTALALGFLGGLASVLVLALLGKKKLF